MPPLHENMTDYEILQEEILLKVQELEVLRRKLAIEDIKRRRKEKKKVQQQTTDEGENDEEAENEDGHDTRATNAVRAAPGFGVSAMEVNMKNAATNAVVIKPEPEDEEVRPAGFIAMTLKNNSKPSNPSSRPMSLVFNDEKPQAPLPPKQPLRRTRYGRLKHLAPELPVPSPARELNRPPTERPATTESLPDSNGSLYPSSREPKVKAEVKTEAQPRPLASKRQKTASTPSSHTSPSGPFITPPSRPYRPSSPSVPAPQSPAASSSSSYASSPSPPRKPSLSPPQENALSFSFEAGDVPQEPRPAYSGTQINKERERGKKGEKRKIVMLGVDGSTKVVEG